MTTTKRQLNAARSFYFLGGFGFTTWAAIIPLLKQRLAIPDDDLGLLLLCLGLGALMMMVFAGKIASRYGCRRPLTVAGVLLPLVFLGLCLVPSYMGAVCLALLLGALLGLMDVVVNINGIMMERLVKKRIMSGLHALWSLGNFAGAACFSVLLHFRLSDRVTTLVSSLLILVLVLYFSPHLMRQSEKSTSARLHLPRGPILMVSLICTLSFLIEGSINDWSGIFMTTEKAVPMSQSSLGLTLFTASVFVVRLFGDALASHIGARQILLASLPIACLGFCGLLAGTSPWLLFPCYICIGVGCANTVPLFYSFLGRQKLVPVTEAIAAVSTIGYAGILVAPAVLGYIASYSSLYASFALVTALLAVMYVMVWHITCHREFQ